MPLNKDPSSRVFSKVMPVCRGVSFLNKGGYPRKEQLVKKTAINIRLKKYLGLIFIFEGSLFNKFITHHREN